MQHNRLATTVWLCLTITLAGSVASGADQPADAGDQNVETIVVTAQRLDAARNGLSPETGSSIYRLDAADIDSLPLGASTPLNQVILQVPGVVQDSFGQLHVRGDHGNLQYRINGIVVPEAISGFGQALDTHFANQINVLTGALPAQYGYRTAGVVDVRTRGYVPQSGGSFNLTAGSHGDREAAADYAGSSGRLSYFVSGSYLQNSLGIENPTPAREALHDDTRQAKVFGYLSYILNNDSRVSFTYGIADSHFQIPDVPGQLPTYPLNGATQLDSATLDARQLEQNHFEILGYQGKLGGSADYQVALLHRYSAVHYRPDIAGDLMFNGIAANIMRSDEEIDLQADISYALNARHTLRTGLFANSERFDARNSALVFATDAAGNPTSDVPQGIVDDSGVSGHTAGIYLQDEWTPREKLTINYGARYDKVDTVVAEQQLSPRLGLVYDLSDDTHLHAGYARYFTPPPTEKIDTTSIAKFANTTNALPSDANTAVSSERSNYFDVGMTRALTPHFNVGLDTYYRQVKNLQDEGQFGKALIFSAFNYEQGRVYGTELTTSYNNDGVTAYANIAYAVAKARNVVTGQFNFDPAELTYIATHWVYVDHDQRWAGSAGASYMRGLTTLSADLLYGSGLRRGFANTGSMPSYTQVNLAAARNFRVRGLGQFSGRVSVLNVFDRGYELRDGSGIGVGAPQFGPRRAFYFTLSKTL